jgi:hypothetical protein
MTLFFPKFFPKFLFEISFFTNRYFYPFSKTRLSNCYFYKSAVLVWTIVFICLEYLCKPQIFLWQKYSSYWNRQFYPFWKLVSMTVIFGAQNIHPNDSCFYEFEKLVSSTCNCTRFGNLGSMTAIPIFLSSKKNRHSHTFWGKWN